MRLRLIMLLNRFVVRRTAESWKWTKCFQNHRRYLTIHWTDTITRLVSTYLNAFSRWIPIWWRKLEFQNVWTLSMLVLSCALEFDTVLVYFMICSKYSIRLVLMGDWLGFKAFWSLDPISLPKLSSSLLIDLAFTTLGGQTIPWILYFELVKFMQISHLEHNFD